MFQGGIATQMTLFRLFDRHIEEVRARVGIDVSTQSLITSHPRRLGEFVSKNYNVKDLISQLNEQFIREFQDYLILERNLGRNRAPLFMILKKICRIAFKEGIPIGITL